ncbi:MAG: hypothetical protein IJA39_04370, partial [Clostridia bacterium]|nr:hypothetical protein [Clostridia bacterium]
MPIKAEAAIITQKRPSQAFNNDSVNLNGKVFDREVIKNGYKGSGIITDNMYFALASSDVEGFADAAVTALIESAEGFSSREPGNVLESYFSMCKEAVSSTAHASSKLSAVTLYACGRRVISCFDGNVKLYSVNANGVNAYSSENTPSSGSCCTSVFPDVSVGDIFLLVTPGVCETLSDKDIADICKVSDGSVKRIASLITKVALSKIDTQAVSVIAVKILETGLDTDGVTGFSPDFSDVIPAAGVSSAESRVSADTEAPDAAEVNAEAGEKTEENGSDTDFVAAVAAAADSRYTEIIGENEETAEGTASEDMTEKSDDSGEESSDSIFGAAGDNTEAEDEQNEEDESSEKKGPQSTRQKFIIAIAALAVLSVMLFIVVFA